MVEGAAAVENLSAHFLCDRHFALFLIAITNIDGFHPDVGRLLTDMRIKASSETVNRRLLLLDLLSRGYP